MTTRLLLALLLVSGGAVLSAHDGHAHLVMGTVTAQDGRAIEIKTPSGEVLKIALNTKTVITREKRKVGLAEVQTGRRVVVDIGNGEDPLIAREIRVGATSLAAK